MNHDRKLIMQISEELIEKIDDYRFKNRIHSRAETVRQLIQKAVSKSKKTALKK